jgi:hypothetical protein
MPWKRYNYDILNRFDTGLLLDIGRGCNEAPIFIGAPRSTSSSRPPALSLRIFRIEAIHKLPIYFVRLGCRTVVYQNFDLLLDILCLAGFVIDRQVIVLLRALGFHTHEKTVFRPTAIHSQWASIRDS